MLQLQQAGAYIGQMPRQKGSDEGHHQWSCIPSAPGLCRGSGQRRVTSCSHRPRQQGQVLGDFIKPTTTKTTTTTTTTKTQNRYSALTVADLSEIDAVVNPPDITSSPISSCFSYLLCPTFVSTSTCLFHLQFLHLGVKRGASLF